VTTEAGVNTAPGAPPPIAVAIACHNNAADVATAIRSALTQVPPPAEVVVCDDGSSDETPDVLAQFGDSIRVVRHPVGRGEAAAKNSAFAAATCDVVVFLDADDEFLRGRLAAIGAVLAARPDVDIVTTDAYLVHDDRVLDRWYGPTHPIPDGDQRSAVLSRNPVFGHAAVRRAAFLRVGGFDEGIRHATDWDCWIRMVLAGSRIAVVDEPLARYHLHGANASADRVAMLSSAIEFLGRAAARDDISAGERSAAHAAIEHRRRLLARERLKAALVDPSRPPVRDLANALVTDPHQARRTRVFASAVMTLPAPARAARRLQDRYWWTGPGGIRLRRADGVSIRSRLSSRFAAQRQPSTRPQVLLTLPDRPWPANGGKRMRASATLRALAAMDIELDVVILFAGAPVADPLPPGVSVRECRQIHAPPRHKLSAVVAASARLVPWQIAVFRWGLARKEMAFVRERSYDLVWFGATDHAVSLKGLVRATRTAVDMDDVEVPKLRAFLALPRDQVYVRESERLQRRVELPLWLRVQRQVERQADALIVCSDLDRSRLGTGKNVAVVPNGYPQPQIRVQRPEAGPPTLVYIGTYYYAPNVDAASFAALQLLPVLRERFPDARLRLVGRGGIETLTALSELPGVDVVGAVPELAVELARAHVCIAPIRYGGGTRVKILEAFAYGVPVVSTPLGCEGIDVVPDVHLLVAADAPGLAHACGRLISDDSLGARISDAGYALYSSRYRDTDIDRVLQNLASTLLPPG
jgi:glycosyltransferase involved in cell wall biosynthesis